MNIRQRAETFSRYVGLELKGKITTQGFTAKSVAEAIGRQPAAFNRWLNGKVEIPMTVFCEACEYVDVEPAKLIEDAYARLAVEFGERDGRMYEGEEQDHLVKRSSGVVGAPDHVAPVIDGGFGKNAQTEEKAEEQLDAAASKRSRDRGEDGDY